MFEIGYAVASHNFWIVLATVDSEQFPQIGLGFEYATKKLFVFGEDRVRLAEWQGQ